MSFALDDAATAALYALRHSPTEQMGALYGESLSRSNIVSSGSRENVKARLQVPGGTTALRALFHNHPLRKHDEMRAAFSDADRSQARRLGVPSYISAGEAVHRFDPRSNTTEEVLAEFPIDEWRAYLMRTLLDRAPDDPRGLMR